MLSLHGPEGPVASETARSITRDSRPANTFSSAPIPASMNTGLSDSWIVCAIVETAGRGIILIIMRNNRAGGKPIPPPP